MGYKIFVSYKYADSSVAELDSENGQTRPKDMVKRVLQIDLTTARDYVDYLQNVKFSGDDFNKAEHDGEDLSQFKDSTIQSKLRDKIWDSSITLVLISKGMKEKWISEADQWIPWEVAYSLRESTREGTISHANAILAIVLPDEDNSYDYFVQRKIVTDDQGKDHPFDNLVFNDTFGIIQKNMFNKIDPDTEYIKGYTLYRGDSSYILDARWEDFVENPECYLELAKDNNAHIDNYKLVKKVEVDN